MEQENKNALIRQALLTYAVLVDADTLVYDDSNGPLTPEYKKAYVDNLRDIAKEYEPKKESVSSWQDSIKTT